MRFIDFKCSHCRCILVVIFFHFCTNLKHILDNLYQSRIRLLGQRSCWCMRLFSCSFPVLVTYSGSPLYMSTSWLPALLWFPIMHPFHVIWYAFTPKLPSHKIMSSTCQTIHYDASQYRVYCPGFTTYHAILDLYLYNTNSVCVSVEYRRPNCWTDHDQIWHAYADRPGNGSYQILAPWMAWKRGVTGANIRIGT